MRIIGTIQARMGSSRLPGKVLRKIKGKSMLQWHIERLRRSRLLDDVIVATTTNKSDDEIEKFCINHNIQYFRGSEEDVLGRIAGVIKEFQVDTHVEFFGDSPLTDPHIVDEIIGYYLKFKHSYDFVSNSLETTYPPGQEVTVFSGEALLKAHHSISLNDPLREHVSIHIYKHPKKFKIKNLKAPAHYNFPNIYLEVDTAEDFELISKIIGFFEDNNYPHFSLSQILDYLQKNPKLISLNNKVERKWKAFREDTNV